MFLKKLLAVVGIHLIETETDKRRVLIDEDQLERELAEFRERCTKLAHTRYVSERVRAEDIVISHSRPDITTAQDLKIIHEEAEKEGRKFELLEGEEVQIIVAECRVRKRIVCRGLGSNFQHAYGSLLRQLGGETVAAPSARRAVPLDVSIELSDADPSHAEIEHKP